MAKHDFESDTMTVHDIMHCTRVNRTGFDKVRVVFVWPFDNLAYEDFEVPARPTGAHRQSDNVWADPNVVILSSLNGGSFECPRVWDDGMAVGFEYIAIPSV